MPIDRFPPNVLDKLGWYVYRLVDPRNGQTFYVGKGQGNRIFDHVKGLVEIDEADILSLKLDTIREIEEVGLEVGHFVHRHGIKDEDAAYEIEAALIEAYPEIANIAGGHGSEEYGCRSVAELVEHYAIDEAKFEHDVILIDISRSFHRKKPTRENLYDSVRLMWVLKKEKAERYEFVLPHRGGVILGVFRPDRWLPATVENFPEFAEMIEMHRSSGRPNRIGFEGREETDPEIVRRYERKRVPPRYRTAPRTPCRYVQASSSDVRA